MKEKDEPAERAYPVERGNGHVAAPMTDARLREIENDRRGFFIRSSVRKEILAELYRLRNVEKVLRKQVEKLTKPEKCVAPFRDQCLRHGVAPKCSWETPMAPEEELLAGMMNQSSLDAPEPEKCSCGRWLELACLRCDGGQG